MSSDSFNTQEVKDHMQLAVKSLAEDYNGLQAGKASTGLVEKVVVEIYGSMSPLKSVANVSVSDPRTLSIQVFDKNNVKAVEKGIINANLGLNPMSEGSVVRINIPQPTEERRKELGKRAGEYAEKAKISIRKARHDAIESVKKQEKAKEISEDVCKRHQEEIEKITKDFSKKIEDMMKQKQQDIMKI